ncbi:MAG: reverse transcriptase domain-containing protein [Candidatus Thiodiazotropha sp.]
MDKLRINGRYVDLVEDAYLQSLIRLKRSIKLKPQSALFCFGKLPKTFSSAGCSHLQIAGIDQCFASNFPGIMLANTITGAVRINKLPLLLINGTNQEVSLRRGSVIGRADPVVEKLVSGLTESIASVEQVKIEDTLSEFDSPSEFKPLVAELLNKNRDLFAAKDSDLTFTDTIKFKIDTGNAPPIRLRPYRIPLRNQPIVHKAVDEMLEAGIIRKSHSQYSFPVVIVDKKDGSKRFCIDFRALNKVTKPISWPLPLIDDVLSLLKGAKYFTSLDMKSGYWQILMDEKDREKTAFSVPGRGLFECNSLPFGLVNAPSVFQSLMAIVLEGLNSFCQAYLDDILIFSATIEDHLSHINQVFDRLRQHKLKLKLKKCSFFKQQTKYLGFVISADGIRPDPDKVKVMKNLPPPTTVKEVRGAIGMLSYYRRYIPNFAEIAAPIIDLTRKYAKFSWTPQCDRAFNFLKESLTIIPLLSYPDVNRGYVLYVDSSDTCIGACLAQPDEENETAESQANPYFKNEKPIYFLSHRLSRSQCKWPIIEKECYAIFYSLNKLNFYLAGASFVIRTDCKPLKYLLDADIKNRRVALWSLSIASYSCQIEYLPGECNTVADLLSRVPKDPNAPSGGSSSAEESLPEINDKTYEIGVLNSNQILPTERKQDATSETELLDQPRPGIMTFNMQDEQAKDPEIQEVLRQMQSGHASKTFLGKYIVIEGVLYFISESDIRPRLRLFVPEHLRELVLETYHTKNGHVGIDKSWQTAKIKYYWPNMYKQFYSYIAQCIPCNERSTKCQKRPLETTEIPPYPFCKVALDISGPFDLSWSKNQYLVSFICLYSGYPESFATPDHKADTICQLLIDEVIARHGCMEQLITDNAPELVGETFEETLKALNIEHIRTTPYCPTSNGLIEHFNGTIKNIIAKYARDNPQSWDLYVPQSLAAARFSVNHSTGFSPHYLVYLTDPVLPLDNILRQRSKYMGEESHLQMLERQHQVFLSVHQNLKRARARQKKYADRGAKDVTFAVGQAVYYKNPLKGKKMSKRWFPYYRITAQLGKKTFLIRNQLNGQLKQAHSKQLQKANLNWKVPKTGPTGRPVRRSTLAKRPDDSADLSSSESNTSSIERASSQKSESESDLRSIKKGQAPRWLIKRKQNIPSSSSETIPPMEMKKRLQFHKVPKTSRVISRGKASQTEQSASKGSNRPNSASSSHMATDSESDSDTIDYEYNVPPALEPDLVSMGSPSGLEGQGNDSTVYMESIHRADPLVELKSSNEHNKVKHLLEAISAIL